MCACGYADLVPSKAKACEKAKQKERNTAVQSHAQQWPGSALRLKIPVSKQPQNERAQTKSQSQQQNPARKEHPLKFALFNRRISAGESFIRSTYSF